MPDNAHIKILFIGTEDKAFTNHRLPMARALKAQGYDVGVIAGESTERARIEAEGLRLVPWKVLRGSLNPFNEIAAILDLKTIVKRERPDILINVALKPILYGGLSARGANGTRTISLFAGLGAVFVNPRPLMKLIQMIIMPILRYVLAPDTAWVVTQNKDNAAFLQALRIGDKNRYALIPGSGVDLNTHAVQPEPDDGGPVVATVAARMLWDKGIRETAEAARMLKAWGVNARIQLVGDPDPHNPATVPLKVLEDFNREGVLTWLGHQKDIQAVWRGSHIALLASYGEGVPKGLLEAAALGRPMVAFDAPGARDLVQNGENGMLVPLGDAEGLAKAIRTLTENPELRRTMGQNARQTVERSYSSEIVGQALCRLVKAVIDNGKP